jgi:hypothetical protein
MEDLSVFSQQLGRGTFGSLPAFAWRDFRYSLNGCVEGLSILSQHLRGGISGNLPEVA